MENTLCKYCVKFLPPDNFEEGKITCKKCLEYKRNQYQKHKDRYNERDRIKYKENEEYRNRKLEGQKERGKDIITCSICNCSFSQAHKSRHNKSFKHKRNLEMNNSQ